MNRPPRTEPAESPRIRMVAIDLDGTLLRSDKSLSETNARAIAEATNRGVHIVLASARPPRSVREIYHRLGLDTLQINYNGALVHDMSRGRHVRHQPMGADLAGQIIRYARKLDTQVAVSLEILDKWYTDRVDDSLPTETSRRFTPDGVGPIERFLDAPVTKLMLLAPPDRMSRLREAVHARFGRQIEILVSDDYLIQLVDRQVDKAKALQAVAEHYGVGREQVMAIGDAPNDLGMIHWAGLGIAMDNGWPELKRVASVVAPSNDEDGVAYVIRRYVLGEEG